MTSTPKPSGEIAALIAIMAALRTPGSGCPWDIVQTFATIAPYTIEEAHEVADAIVRGDMVDLVDELGDLLLQVVFHARMAEEAGHFAFPDVVKAITAKLIRRHPHVFAHVFARDFTDVSDSAAEPGPDRLSPDEVKGLWSRIKAEEKAARKAARAAAGLPDDSPAGLLDGVPVTLPALARAVKLQARAGAAGFDWNDPRAVIAKIREELDEFEAELDTADRQAQHDELGDLLFAVANLARHADIDPDGAVRSANHKFERRFRFIEDALAARGKTPAESSLEEMDGLWNAAKAAEKAGR